MCIRREEARLFDLSSDVFVFYDLFFIGFSCPHLVFVFFFD